MSVTTAVAKFKARYPSIVSAFSLTDDTIEVFIEEAALEMSACVLGAYYQKCVLLHAAHFLVLESYANYKAVDPAGAASAFTSAGGMSSFSVGDTSVTRDLNSDIKTIDGNMNATLYGQDLLRILAKLGKGGLVAKERATDICAPPDSPGVLF